MSEMKFCTNSHSQTHYKNNQTDEQNFQMETKIRRKRNNNENKTIAECITSVYYDALPYDGKQSSFFFILKPKTDEEKMQKENQIELFFKEKKTKCIHEQIYHIAITKKKIKWTAIKKKRHDEIKRQI